MNQTALNELVDTLRSSRALASKSDISQVAQGLSGGHPLPYPNGDDTSAILNSSGGYDLVSCEGFIPEFVNEDPWFAGWCGVMVNVSDITAMGGKPVAITNTIWASDSPAHNAEVSALLKGMADASNVLEVPVVGGHTNLRCQSDDLYFGVSIYGRARALLSSFKAKPGEHLVMAVDLRGAFREPYLNWNAATNAPPKRLRGDLELLPLIAESGLASAAKDISQAGILGTTLMLMESSGCGCSIETDHIPRPPGVSLLDWCQAFPSFGYLLSVPEKHLARVCELFRSRDIAAASIGELNREGLIRVTSKSGKSDAVFWDLEQDSLMGFATQTCEPN